MALLRRMAAPEDAAAPDMGASRSTDSSSSPASPTSAPKILVNNCSELRAKVDSLVAKGSVEKRSQSMDPKWRKVADEKGKCKTTM